MAHQKGRARSDNNPSPANVSQNIFRCMTPAYFERTSDFVERSDTPMPHVPFRRHCYLSDIAFWVITGLAVLDNRATVDAAAQRLAPWH